MNKAELIEAVAFDARLKKAAAAAAVDAVIAIIIHAAGRDGARISGFGTFTSRRREARYGRNMKTGEPLQVPAMMVAKFLPSKAFKARLNGREA